MQVSQVGVVAGVLLGPHLGQARLNRCIGGLVQGARRNSTDTP